MKDLDLSDGNNAINFFQTNDSMIENNSLHNNQRGIYLKDSSNNTITKNSAINNSYGIYFESSSNNTIKVNDVIYNDRGIYLDTSWSNRLRNNSMKENRLNFGAEGAKSSELDNDIDKSNSVNEKPVYYRVGVSDEVIDSFSNAGVVYCIDCENITVKDLTITNNLYGIYFHNTTDSLIENNSISQSDTGINLIYSGKNTISYNNANNNGYGIYLCYSNYNGLIANNVSFNHYDGIKLRDSDYNVINANNASCNDKSGIHFDCLGNNLTDNTLVGNVEYPTNFGEGYQDNNVKPGPSSALSEPTPTGPPVKRPSRGDDGNRNATVNVKPKDYRSFRELIKSELDKLEPGRFGFNPEREMIVGRTYRIEAWVSGMEVPKEELEEGLSKYGGVEVKQIKISPYMKVTLEGGDKFSINPIGEERKPIVEITKWKWNVKPLESGTHNLTLHAVVEIFDPSTNGWECGREWEVASESIEVTAIPLSERIRRFLVDNWQYVISTILIPVAGWYIRHRTKQKKKPPIGRLFFVHIGI